jgi:fibro-slime domain-containing protein
MQPRTISSNLANPPIVGALLASLVALFLVACSGGDDAGSGFAGSRSSGSSGSGSGTGGASAGTGFTAGAGGTIIITPPDGGFSSGAGGSGADGGCGSNLTGLLRDFHASPPEFEGPTGNDIGLVQSMLGADGKPVYAGPAGGTRTTSGQAKFDEWYRDVAGVNMRKPFTIPFQMGADGISTYANQSFFPIDDDLFGNEGNPHNFHFTFELHTTFVYKSGDTFRFRGDDDLWLFINKQLVIDLGGVHGAQERAISLDQVASTIGIAPGGEYSFDLFYNERHTTQSEIEVQMTLVFKDCGVVPR